LDLFHKGATTALGFTGPTQATIGAFADHDEFPVDRGSKFFGARPAPPVGSLIVTADLTPVHQANTTFQGGPGGHHTDIFLPEIYDLMCWFLF